MSDRSQKVAPIWKVATLASLVLAGFSWVRHRDASAMPVEAGSESQHARHIPRPEEISRSWATQQHQRVADLADRLATARSLMLACTVYADLARTGDEDASAIVARDVLARRDAATRSCGAEALAHWVDDTAMNALQTLANDEDHDVRIAALASLAGTGIERAVGIVIEMAQTGPSERRNDALVALGDAHVVSAAPLITRALNGAADETTRQRLVTALGRAGDPSSIDVLTHYTTDLSSQIRAAALDALGSIGGDRAIAVLTDMVSHGTADDSSAAAMALADSHEPGARAVLLDLAAGDDSIALRAATALIGADGEDVAALMRTRLASDEPEIAMIGVRHATVRRDREAIPRLAELAGRRLRGFMRSVDAIRTIGGDGAQSALERLASRPGPARPWAIDALVAIPATHQRAIELAMEIVREEGGRDVSMALRVLARDPGDSAREALFDCVRSGGPIGESALRLLGERRDAESERLLIQTAFDTTSAHQSLRATAIRALAQMGGPGSEAEHAVIAAITDPRMNAVAIGELASMGTPTASRALLDVAASPDADEYIRAQAIQGACRQGVCDARGLARLIDDPNVGVAGAALDALCQRSPTEARMQIEALLRSTEPSRRTLAVTGAAGLRPDDARPILLAALSDPEASVAIEAIRHFDSVGGRATQDALVATMTNDGALEEVRAEAASYLREQGGPLSRTYSVLIDRLTGESGNGDVIIDSDSYDSTE